MGSGSGADMPYGHFISSLVLCSQAGMRLNLAQFAGNVKGFCTKSRPNVHDRPNVPERVLSGTAGAVIFAVTQHAQHAIGALFGGKKFGNNFPVFVPVDKNVLGGRNEAMLDPPVTAK